MVNGNFHSSIYKICKSKDNVPLSDGLTYIIANEPYYSKIYNNKPKKKVQMELKFPISVWLMWLINRVVWPCWMIDAQLMPMRPMTVRVVGCKAGWGKVNMV